MHCASSMNHRMHNALGGIWQNWTSSILYCVRPFVSFFANERSTQSLPICDTSYTGFPTHNELNTRSACFSTSAEKTRRLLTSLRCCILWFLPRYTYNLRSESEKMYIFDIPKTRSFGSTKFFCVPYSLEQSAVFSLGDCVTQHWDVQESPCFPGL